MNRKRVASVIVILMLLLMLSSCQGIEETNMITTENFVKGFIADNSKSLEDILTVEYNLQDLRDFFGEINANENTGYESSNSEKPLTIDYVNEKFPIECLRLDHYTVYKVKEGGYFYVFWSVCVEPTSDEKSEAGLKDVNNATVYFTAYLPSASFKKASDFSSIQENISTAEDVAAIDPAFELNLLLSSRIASFSLLQDGTIMEINYIRNPEYKSRGDLIVESKKVISREKAHPCLASVLLTDLPID